MARPPLDAESLRAAAMLAGLDLTPERSRFLCGDADRLFRLYDRLMQAAPDDVPPAPVFRVARRRWHDH